jgi:hypothetical protein
MLTCRDVAARASDAADDRLGWRERLAFWLHLLVCRACRQYVRQLALTRAALRALGRSNDPVTAERLQRIRARESGPPTEDPSDVR